MSSFHHSGLFLQIYIWQLELAPLSGVHCGH